MSDSWWTILVGIGVGAQFIDGLWVALVLMPMWLDQDLSRAFQTLTENGARDPLTGIVALASVLFVVTLIGLAFGVRFVERRYRGRTLPGILARFAFVFFAVGASGIAASIPAQLMSFPLADLVEPSPAQESTYSMWLAVFTAVQLSSFVLAVLLGVATWIASRLARRP